MDVRYDWLPCHDSLIWTLASTLSASTLLSHHLLSHCAIHKGHATPHRKSMKGSAQVAASGLTVHPSPCFSSHCFIGESITAVSLQQEWWLQLFSWTCWLFLWLFLRGPLQIASIVQQSNNILKQKSSICSCLGSWNQQMFFFFFFFILFSFILTISPPLSKVSINCKLVKFFTWPIPVLWAVNNTQQK